MSDEKSPDKLGNVSDEFLKRTERERLRRENNRMLIDLTKQGKEFLERIELLRVAQQVDLMEVMGTHLDKLEEEVFAFRRAERPSNIGIIIAEATPDAKKVIGRCEQALSYATRMTQYVRPHPYDNAEMRRGKFEFYKRLLALQVEAVKLLETYELGDVAGPEKAAKLLGRLQKAGLVTPEHGKLILEKLYPPDATVVSFNKKRESIQS